jgi:hypothetical protein
MTQRRQFIQAAAITPFAIAATPHQSPLKDFQELLNNIQNCMTHHAGSKVFAYDTPANFGWLVWWRDPVTNQEYSEQFEVSQDDVETLVDAIPNDESGNNEILKVLLKRHLRTHEGRTVIGMSCVQPARYKRAWLQRQGKLPPNTPREDKLEQGV